MRGRQRRPLMAAALAAAVFSLYPFGSAAWIPAKAWLAQALIERSWRASAIAEPTPPWPWADTRPVAVLEVPRLDRRLHVLAGASGRSLAFGPVLAEGYGGGLDLLVSGHRDTHFRFLEELRDGDRLLWSTHGEQRWFEVRQREVIDSRRAEPVLEPAISRLSLVTCYPFDSVVAGGPLRYVVTAVPLAAADQ